MSAQRITRVLLSDSVYETLHRSILTGELKPGDRLRELDLAEQYGTSQAPIREALKRLEQEGMVQRIAFKGSFVTSLTEEEILDIYSIRAFLESLSIQRAIENITEDQFGELAEIVDDMAKAAKNNDIAELTIKDALFHEKICEISGSHLLQQLLGIIGGKSRLAIATADRFYSHNLMEVVDVHRPILDGLKNRDVDMTVESNNTHLKWVLSQVGKELITEISGFKHEDHE